MATSCKAERIGAEKSKGEAAELASNTAELESN